MGNCFSGESNRLSGSQPEAAEEGITSNGKAIPSMAARARDQQLDGTKFKFTEPCPNKEPSTPAYGSDTLHAQILRCYADCQRRIDLQDLRTWNTLVVVDPSLQAPASLQNAILMIAWLLICPLQALNAPTQLEVMEYNNTEMRSASEDENQALKVLNQLFIQEEARDVMDELKKEHNKSPWLARRRFEEKLQGIMNSQTLQDRHTKMLVEIRKLRAELSEPWKVKNMTLTRLEQIWKHGGDFVSRQPKIVNSATFNIVRSVEQQLARHTARQGDKTATFNRHKVIVITASSMSQSGYEHVKNELNKVTGGSTEFSITTISLYQGDLDIATKSFHQKLDDQNVHDEDIYDFVPVDANLLLSNGPSGELLAKIMASHDHKWDRAKVKKQEYYGPQHCYSNSTGKIILPSVVEVQAHLHLDSAECAQERIAVR